MTKMSDWDEIPIWSEKEDEKCLFSWDEIPGNDNNKLIKFLREKFEIDWIKCENIEKIDGDKTIKCTDENKSILLELNDEKTTVGLKMSDLDEIPIQSEKEDKRYSFNWDKIPGNDNNWLIEFLRENFEIDWVKCENIKKTDDGKTIKCSDGNNSILLERNNEKTTVKLTISDIRNYKIIAKKENDKLNIYDRSGFIFFDKFTKERIPVTRIEKWRDFTKLVDSNLFERDNTKLIFRGHRRWDWHLSPTLGRKPYSEDGKVTKEKATEMHELFRKAVRGRLSDPSFVDTSNVDELWAVGQHYGLKPL